MTAKPSDQAAQWAALGRVLKHQRELQQLSCAAVGKKIGLSAEQVEAIEEGRHEVFKKTAQPLWWFVRLYAKKLGVDLPLEVNQPMRATGQASVSAQTIPSFLLKNSPDACTGP
jgi:transcriptional regulator with XRE-family HTH domain